MAARQRRELDNSEDDESLETVEGFGLLRYQFEPECAGGEPVSAEEASESSNSDTELRGEGEHDVWRVRNHDWCSCELCGPLPTRRESHCCHAEIGCLGRQEIRRRDHVGEGKLLLFPSFIAWHAIVSPRFTV